MKGPPHDEAALICPLQGCEAALQRFESDRKLRKDSCGECQAGQ